MKSMWHAASLIIALPLVLLGANRAQSRVGADLIVFKEISGKKIAFVRDLLALNTPQDDRPSQVDSPRKSVRYAEVDLDDDGTPEVLLAVADAYHCGSAGCTVYLYQKRGERWTFVTPIWSDPGDLLVLGRSDKGYRRLIHIYEDTNADRPGKDGVYPRHYELLSWTGSGYSYEPVTFETFTRETTP
ncbi:hypothetical protein [Nitrospirillum sp. BR 11828]|uniref:hypothetical protein n=1 Tax=Nitrospirillum sp. BR 11828 TaxID=3104325 RepID=UPI002ACADDDD|nr:hypothetical protein [Nitrospirillum sp. BR 11828]MDZ5648967.1 hypothetical protein [Nitrospirillum sp. BR 11828]